MSSEKNGSPERHFRDIIHDASLRRPLLALVGISLVLRVVVVAATRDMPLRNDPFDYNRIAV